VERPYHPALARLAAQHDEVIREMREGRLTPAEARRRVKMLVARDDTGVEWSIDPDTGAWRYRDRSGTFAYGEPPAIGDRGSEPSDVGSAGRRAGWDRVHLHEVPDHVRPRRLAPADQLSAGRRPPKRKYVLLAVLSAVLIVTVTALFA